MYGASIDPHIPAQPTSSQEATCLETQLKHRFISNVEGYEAPAREAAVGYSRAARLLALCLAEAPAGHQRRGASPTCRWRNGMRPATC